MLGWMSIAHRICGPPARRWINLIQRARNAHSSGDATCAHGMKLYQEGASYEPVGETICTPFTGARVAAPVPGVAVSVNDAAVRLRNTM